MPGQVKTVSVITAPPTISGMARPDDRENGDQGIAKSVAQYHYPFAQTLGACRGYVSGAHDFEHRRTGVAHKNGNVAEAQNHGRQGEVMQRVGQGWFAHGRDNTTNRKKF